MRLHCKTVGAYSVRFDHRPGLFPYQVWKGLTFVSDHETEAEAVKYAELHHEADSYPVALASRKAIQ